MKMGSGPLLVALLLVRLPTKADVLQVTHPGAEASTGHGLVPMTIASSEELELNPLPVMLTSVPPARLPAAGEMPETERGTWRDEALEKPSGETRRRSA